MLGTRIATKVAEAWSTPQGIVLQWDKPIKQADLEMSVSKMPVGPRRNQ